MKIYIAGASAELDIVQGYMRRVRAAGWEVTHDWTAQVAEARAANINDTNISDQEAAEHATDDLVKGVSAADLLWFIVPPKGRSAGSWVEYGFALAIVPFLKERKREYTVVVSGDVAQSIFLRLSSYRFDSHEKACTFLEVIAKNVKALPGQSKEVETASHG